MSSKNKVVYGIYRGKSEVESAVSILKSSGFRHTDISFLMPDNTESNKEFMHSKSSKAPEGTTVGGGAGAILGGVLGWLAGLGVIAIPTVGPFIAAGPIMGLLAGLGVGSTLGGLTGALIGLGMPEYEAKRYEGIITSGGILLSVHCDNTEWSNKAEELLKNTGAKDISSTGEASANIKVDEHNQILKKAV